jgi:NADH-quinone oxidoreductase subunit N
LAITEVLTRCFVYVVPEAILGLTACVLFLGSTVRRSRDLWGAVALVGLAFATLAECFGPDPSYKTEDGARAWLFAAPLVFDLLTGLVRMVVFVGAGVLVLMNWDEVDDAHAGEFHACLLLIAAGVTLSSAANELVTLFLALELVSIPTYILLYLTKADEAAQEAAMKYFLLSIFSSGFLLFGFSYLYGLAGTTNLPAIHDALANAAGGVPALAVVALVMIVAALGFRITAVPFHFYAPDVYQGTSTGAAAMLSFMPKVVGFTALVRLLGLVPLTLTPERGPAAQSAHLVLGDQVSVLLWIMAAVTMSLGNVLALLQDNVKRMLAYSSVAHAGYMLIGIAVAPRLASAAGGHRGGVDAVLFYLVAYGAMTIGAFAVLSFLSTPQRTVETVDDLAGLCRTHPGTALMMVLFLFSLLGMPLTAGFIGKVLLFWGALGVPIPGQDAMNRLPDMEVDQLFKQAALFRILAVIAAINAAIGAWYYLRIAAVMFLREPLEPIVRRRSGPVVAAMWLCAVITLLLGIWSAPLIDATRQAAPRPSPREEEAALATPAHVGD